MKDPKHKDAVLAELLPRALSAAKSWKSKDELIGELKKLLELAYDAGYKKACKDWSQAQTNEYWYPYD